MKENYTSSSSFFFLNLGRYNLSIGHVLFFLEGKEKKHLGLFNHPSTDSVVS